MLFFLSYTLDERVPGGREVPAEECLYLFEG